MKALISLIFKTVFGFVTLKSDTKSGAVASVFLWGWALMDLLSLLDMVS